MPSALWRTLKGGREGVREGTKGLEGREGKEGRRERE